MTNRFMISVAAAALIAGTGFANAQGAGGATQGGSTAQQHSAPSAGGSAAPSRESAPSSGMTTGQSEKAAPAGKQAEDLKGGKAPQNTATDTKGGKDMKAEGRDSKEKATVGQAPEKSGTTTQREDKMGSDKSAPSSAQGGQDRMNAQGQKGSMENKGSTEQKGAQTSPSGSSTTTGNAATSARVAAPPAEKQTQIVSAIKSETHPGDQRQRERLHRHRVAGLGSFRSAAAPDRRNLSGVARLRGGADPRPLRDRASADA